VADEGSSVHVVEFMRVVRVQQRSLLPAAAGLDASGQQCGTLTKRALLQQLLQLLQ
jgi:hypothetical protein